MLLKIYKWKNFSIILILVNQLMILNVNLIFITVSADIKYDYDEHLKEN